MNDPEPDRPDPPDALGTSPLEELIVEALGRLEEGGQEGLERFLASCPDRAPRVRSALAVLVARGLAATEPAATAAEPFPERLGGFELIRPLGGGGMGVVYLAREEGLEREVALKLVRPDQLHFPGARERFRREMRTVASLQHPGIVPLFAVGEERGLPFYAMELVRGVTLAELVRRLAGRDPATLSGADLRDALLEGSEAADQPPALSELPELPELFRGRWEEVALRIARRIADALDHAHRRGVVHRDVKPSNVMLAADGRVQLVDFGLSSQRGDVRITRSGSPLGSLAYMAPEMLRGEAPEDDPRLDVYSLGVTLCELATLRLPFPSESEARLRQAVLAGAPSVRAGLPSASWELETLVAVACDPDPARRYPSMAAFARDLDNALRRIPLEARPPGRALRARRWIQRHPVAALAGFALAVGPSLLALQEVRNGRIVLAKSEEIAAQSAEIQAQSETLEDQNRALAAALDAEEAERARAERNLDKALEAVDRMLTRVGDQELADVPHFEQVRRRLLEDALAFYGWFLEREERGEVLVEYVHSVVRAAHLNAVLGRPERGIRLLEETEDKLSAAGGAERFPAATIWLRSERASMVLTAENDKAGAARLLDGCDLLLAGSELDAADPQRLVLAGRLAAERALLERARGDIQAALASNARAVEILSSLSADALPVTSRRVFDVAENLLHALDLRAALMEMRVADLPPEEVRPWRERSIPVLDQAADLARTALADEPESVTHRALLVRILSNRAGCWLNLGQNDQAIASAREACAIGRPLVRDFPSIEDFAKDTTTAAAMLAGLLAAAGEVQEAEDVGTWAVDELATRGAEHSTTPWMRGSYGTALGNLAIVRWKQGRIDDCLELHRRAAEQFDEAVRLAPGVGFFEEARRQSIARHAGSLIALGRHDEAFLLVHELYERTRGAADLLLLARTGALCVTSLETIEQDPDRRAELAETYAALVADELHHALQARSLTTDQLAALDLDSLRGCEAFVDVP